MKVVEQAAALVELLTAALAESALPVAEPQQVALDVAAVGAQEQEQTGAQAAARASP
jgi:hypothetical protein